LLVPPGGLAVNRYNRDMADGWYSMTPDELEEASASARRPDQ